MIAEVVMLIVHHWIRWMGFVSREARGRWEEWMSSDSPEQIDPQMSEMRYISYLPYFPH